MQTVNLITKYLQLKPKLFGYFFALGAGWKLLILYIIFCSARTLGIIFKVMLKNKRRSCWSSDFTIALMFRINGKFCSLLLHTLDPCYQLLFHSVMTMHPLSSPSNCYILPILMNCCALFPQTFLAQNHSSFCLSASTD